VSFIIIYVKVSFNYQGFLEAKSNFCLIGDFFKPCLSRARLGLKNRQVGEKWVSDDYNSLMMGCAFSVAEDCLDESIEDAINAPIAPPPPL
jgi:hypothetical protein